MHHFPGEINPISDSSKKNFPLVFNQNLPSSSFYPLPLVFSMWLLVKSEFPSSLGAPFKYWTMVIRFRLSLLFSTFTKPNFLSHFPTQTSQSFGHLHALLSPASPHNILYSLVPNCNQYSRCPDKCWAELYNDFSISAGALSLFVLPSILLANFDTLWFISILTSRLGLFISCSYASQRSN